MGQSILDVIKNERKAKIIEVYASEKDTPQEKTPAIGFQVYDADDD